MVMDCIIIQEVIKGLTILCYAVQEEDKFPSQISGPLFAWCTFFFFTSLWPAL